MRSFSLENFFLKKKKIRQRLKESCNERATFIIIQYSQNRYCLDRLIDYNHCKTRSMTSFYFLLTFFTFPKVLAIHRSVMTFVLLVSVICISLTYLYNSSVSVANTSGGAYGNHSFLRRTGVPDRRVSPKSQSLTREKSDLKTRTLSSLTSLCTRSLEWRCSNAEASY